MENDKQTIVLFGSAKVSRCQAKSKRSAVQCRKAAMQNKNVCRTHGGASTGPKTPEGRQRCSEAKTIHGRDTQQTRCKAPRTTGLGAYDEGNWPDLLIPVRWPVLQHTEYEYSDRSKNLRAYSYSRWDYLHRVRLGVPPGWGYKTSQTLMGSSQSSPTSLYCKRVPIRGPTQTLNYFHNLNQ